MSWYTVMPCFFTQKLSADTVFHVVQRRTRTSRRTAEVNWRSWRQRWIIWSKPWRSGVIFLLYVIVVFEVDFKAPGSARKCSAGPPAGILKAVQPSVCRRVPWEEIPPQNSGEPTGESGLCARYQDVRRSSARIQVVRSGPLVCFLFSDKLSWSNSFSCFLFPPTSDCQLLADITIVVTNPVVPFGLHRRKPVPVGWQETDFQTLLPTLELWAQQLCLLKVKIPLSHAVLTLLRRNNFAGFFFSFWGPEKGFKQTE